MRAAAQVTGASDTRRANQPGPVYDNTFKLLAAHDLAAVCETVGIPIEPSSVRLSESLPDAGARIADLLIRIGPHRLAHIEFERQP